MRFVRLAAAAAAVVLLAGCGGQPSPASPGSVPPPATQPAPAPPTGDLGVDCEGDPQEPVGPWQEWLIGPATSECDVTLADDLWLWVDDWYGSLNGYAIHVVPDRHVDKVAGHEVVIDNVEFLQDEEIHSMAGFAFTEPNGHHVAEELAKARSNFDQWSERLTPLWTKAFGGPITFEEKVQVFHPDGNTLRIAPDITEADCPGCDREVMRDMTRTVWVEFEGPGVIVRAIKFDVTVDGGEPRTLVYSTTCCYYDR